MQPTLKRKERNQMHVISLARRFPKDLLPLIGLLCSSLHRRGLCLSECPEILLLTRTLQASRTAGWHAPPPRNARGDSKLRTRPRGRTPDVLHRTHGGRLKISPTRIHTVSEDFVGMGSSSDVSSWVAPFFSG